MRERHEDTSDRLARTLAWAGLGLGVAHIAGPRVAARIGGAGGSPAARPPFAGMRELLHAGVLTSARGPATRIWSRVAGDAADLTPAGGSATPRFDRRRRRIAAVTGVIVAVAAVDAYAAMRAGRRRAGTAGPGQAGGARGVLDLHAAITVKRPREDVYRFWHNFENFPRFMVHVESVEASDGQTHWRVRGPAGKGVEWDAEIVEDRRDQLIAWRSTHGALVPNSGSVRFADAPGDRGTEVRVSLRYHPPGGRAGLVFARLMGEHPEQQVRDDLRRFKQVMETGEVVRSEGSPEGTRALRQVLQRPAQPVG
ncbi:SRPBCC family protein [Microbispora sp. NPDC049125]|uniref:SRPBCC family protein n=1 Tax=Microbispora sp. NPDC049125 TaxID=3154929 RepID=UPI003465AD32